MVKNVRVFVVCRQLGSPTVGAGGRYLRVMEPWRALQSQATVAAVHSRVKTPDPGAVSAQVPWGAPNSSSHSAARGLTLSPLVHPNHV